MTDYRSKGPTGPVCRHVGNPVTCPACRGINVGNYRCTQCSFRAVGSPSLPIFHEQTEGHRVVLWDTPTSQAPRDWWTSEPPPSSPARSAEQNLSPVTQSNDPQGDR